MLSALLFSGTVVVLSRNHIVQNYIVQRMAQYLSKELKTKVELGYVEIDFLRNIHLEHLRIYDRQGDTMIEIRQIEAKVSILDLVKGVVQLSEVTLFKPKVKIGFHPGVDDLNIDFFVNFFDPPGKKSTGKGFDFTIRDVKIIDGIFVNFDGNQKSADSYFDPLYQRFSEMNIAMDSLVFGEPWFGAKITSMSAKERSGLKIVKAQMKVSVNRKHILLDQLRIETPCSILANRFEMKYKSIQSLNDIFEKVIFDIQLVNSKLCLEELISINPWFKNRNLPLFVNAHAIGSLNDLALRKFDIKSLTDDTRLRGIGRIKNLGELDNFHYELQLTESRLAMTDAQRVVYEIDSMDLPSKIGVAQFDGLLQGGLTDLAFDGRLSTISGSFDGQFALDMGVEAESILSYQILGGLEGIDLGLLTSAAIDGNLVSGNIDAKGQGFAANNMDLKAVLGFSNYSISGRGFSDIELKMEVVRDEMQLWVDSKDPNFLFSGDAVVYGWDDNPNVEASLELENVLFEKIGLQEMPMVISANLSFIYGGEDAANSNATLELQQLVADHGKSRYFCNNQQIVKTKSRGWEFSGDWINGNISADFDFDKTPQIAKYFLHQHLPERFDAPKQFAPKDFQFDVKILQTSWLKAFVDTSLETGPINLVGKFEQGFDKINFVLGPIDLDWQGASFQRLKLMVNATEAGKLSLEAGAGDVYYGETNYDRFSIMGKLYDGSLAMALDLHDKRDRYNFSLGAISKIAQDSFSTNITSADFKINQDPWQLDKASRLDLKYGGRWEISNLMLNSSQHYVQLDGNISKYLRDTFTIEMGNITPGLLMPFFPEGSFDSLSFHAGGKVRIAAMLGKYKVFGQCYLNDLKYDGYNYGSFDLNLIERQQGDIGFDFEGRKGVLRGLKYTGDLNLDGAVAKLDAKLKLPKKTTVKILQPFLNGILTAEEGVLDGEVKMVGSVNNLVMQGEVIASDVLMGVDYLKTKYRFNSAFQIRSNGIFTADPMTIYGILRRGSAKATLALTHNHFKNLAVDFNMYDAKSIRILETTEADNSLFYGTAWGSGSCRVSGPINKVNIKVEMSPSKNSKLSILYPSTSANAVAGDIVFRNHFGVVMDKEKKKVVSSSLGNVEILIHATPELETEFLIDKRLGDVIRARGSGDIRLLYDEKERFYLDGQYTIKSGEYIFSLPGINVLTKKISLDEGGKIIWVGDPYDANLSLSGRFQKRISPATLMMAGNTQSNTTIPNTLIVSILNISGSLLKPQIGFDIQAPELEASATSTSDVNSVIQRIRQDKDETMRQSIALLIFGNFLPPSFASGNPTNGSVVSGAGVAGNSVSNIASSVMNDLFTKYSIPTRIQVKYDDVRNSKGGSNAQLFVNSEWFISDRLRLDLNYDPTVAMVVNSIAVPFNFKLEYMTRNENWRLKMFSRSSNLQLQSAGTLNNTVSGNTLGGGAVYHKEFDTFRKKKARADEFKED